MDNSFAKKHVYEQMKLIIAERRELTKQYYELKERLDILDNSKIEGESIQNNLVEIETNKTKLKKESDYYIYMLSKKTSQSKNVPYQVIGLTISSILKGAGRPLSNKEIYTILSESNEIYVSYNNLTMNILPKMGKDSKMNVERAHRGYWQYRLKAI
ncbi:hypothetical protein ACX1Q8_002094 [Enterococcus faecalis]